MENLNPKCYKNIYKNWQILKFQNENETKKKSFLVNYIHSILCFFQTSKYIMHIAKNYLHYPSLKNLDFLKQYNYLQLYIHLHSWQKDNGIMVSISKYPQWILRWLKKIKN